MNPTLPFSEFLDLLRARNFGVGLHEYLAVGKLLTHWDGTSRDELRNSLAALIARHDEEVEAIRQLFDACYPPADRPEPGGGSGTGGRDDTRTARFVRLVENPWLWAGVLLALLAAAVATTTVQTLTSQPLPAVARGLPLPPVATALPPPAVTQETPTGNPYPPPDSQLLPPLPALAVPPPPSRVAWRSLGWLGGSVLALTFLPLWFVRAVAGVRRWNAAAWDSALARLPGPFYGTLVLKDLVTHLPRADVEEAATIMGRRFARDGQSRRLDVTRTLRATIRGGMAPRLVFRPRRSLDAMLVLRDVSQPMAIHDARVSALIGDLRRQGIALDVWFFDGDPARPSPRPHAAGTPLDGLLRRRQDGPMVIVSTGHGLAAALRGGDPPWVATLRQQTRRVWINPIVDPKLWPAQLQHLPITAVPMTRAGLQQAARLVTQDDRSLALTLGRLGDRPVSVTRAHVDRLKQLASVVPYPTVALLELLRQRFAPDVPEAAVLYTVDRQAALSDRPFRMSDDDVRTQLTKLRASTPALEAPVRQYLLTVLSDSPPPAGSAAYLRWKAAIALHQVHLADLRQSTDSGAGAVLQELYQGPLWEEVREMIGRQPSAGPAASRIERDVSGGRGQRPPTFAAGASGWAGIQPFRLTAPGWRAAAAAALVAAAAVGGGAFWPAFRVQASHRTDAYVLDYTPASGTSPDRLGIRLARAAAGTTPPLSVQLYEDGGAPRSISLTAGTTTVVPIDAGPSHIYQVRGALSDGALALSNMVWAPSVPVLIDVLPWATVTMTSTQPDALPVTQATPIRMYLPAGRYTLQIRNDVLNASATETIDVTAGAERQFTFTLPGYTPGDILNQLGIRRAPSASAK